MTGVSPAGMAVSHGVSGGPAPIADREIPRLRALLVRSLHETGWFTVDQIGELTGMSGKTVRRKLAEAPGGPAPDREGGASATGRRPRTFVGVTAKLMAALRRDYGRGAATDLGVRLGDLPEVAESLESLEARRLARA